MWGKRAPGRENSQCKGLGGTWLVCLRNSEEADVLEQSEREGGMGDEVGQTMGPCVHSTDHGATWRL